MFQACRFGFFIEFRPEAPRKVRKTLKHENSQIFKKCAFLGKFPGFCKIPRKFGKILLAEHPNSVLTEHFVFRFRFFPLFTTFFHDRSELFEGFHLEIFNCVATLSIDFSRLLGCLLIDFSGIWGPVGSHNFPARFGAILKARNYMFQASRRGFPMKFRPVAPRKVQKSSRHENCEIFKIFVFDKFPTNPRFLRKYRQNTRNPFEIEQLFPRS